MAKVNQNNYGSASVGASTKDKLIDLLSGSSCIMINEEQVFIEIDDLDYYEEPFYEILGRANIQKDDLDGMHAILLY